MSRIDCPSPDTLAAFVLGKLPHPSSRPWPSISTSAPNCEQKTASSTGWPTRSSRS